MDFSRRHALKLTTFQLLVAYAPSAFAQRGGLLTHVEYHGKVFQTARPYRDFDAYRNSNAAQFTEAELSKIQATIVGQSFGPTFRTPNDLDERFEALRFPGYGSFYANQLGARLDASLELMYVELPRSNTHRYLAVERTASGSFQVVADFVAAAIPELVRVRRAADGQLEFMAHDLKVVLRRRVP